MENYQEMTIGANGVKQYQNIGNAQLYGGEAALRLSKGKHVAFSSVNTFTRGVDEDRFSLPLISPFVSVNTLYAKFKGYQAEAELETAAAQRKVSLERYGETATPSASILNLGLRKSYPFGKSELMLAFRVENLLDTYYHRHLDIMKIARPGRNFITNLTVRF
ncbi:TonB-dependent receptor [Pseudoxanthomonas sp. SGD-10]|nr:TonB-dependent receptor [Pseudoxanthomonas sp. SGD-10]